MMQATRLGARLLLAVVFVTSAGCSKDTPTSPAVELVGTLKISGTGKQTYLGEIWMEEGNADLSVKASVDELRDTGGTVWGSGTGVALYDASTPGCTNVGKWDATYAVQGQLTGSNCTLALRVDIKWTNGVAGGICKGIATSMPAPDYSYSLPAIFENNAHEIHTTMVDGGIAWSFRFEMQRFDSTGVTRCQFNS